MAVQTWNTGSWQQTNANQRLVVIMSDDPFVTLRIMYISSRKSKS